MRTVRRTRARPLVVVLALLSVTLVVLDQAGEHSPVEPVRVAARDVFASVGDAADRLWPFGDGGGDGTALAKENDSLRAQLADAQGRLAQSVDAQRELTRLNELMALPSADGAEKVLARVTGMMGSNFDATIELSKGTDAGVKVGMPVVTAKGLVGRVVQVSANRSTVLLVTDATSSVGIRYSASGDVGVAAGQGSSHELRGDLVDLSSQVQPGEVVVTSGMQHSLFPPGIPVATVASAGAGPHDLRKDVHLDPIVDLGALADVAVLKWDADR